MSSYGSKWDDVFLAVFTAYLDDSGTAPDQPVAMASSVIIPVRQTKALNQEWAGFLEREGISEFHTSECIARNKRSAYADWDDARVGRVLSRIRQIIWKYAAQSFSISVNKAVYDAAIPDDLRRVIGKSHYTWGIDAVCGFIHAWGKTTKCPSNMFSTIPTNDKRKK